MSRQGIATEKLDQRTEIHFWHDKEMATFEEEAVGHQGMEMGMSAGVISETFAEITAFEVFANDM